jgi:hypothetical protein
MDLKTEYSNRGHFITRISPKLRLFPSFFALIKTSMIHSVTSYDSAQSCKEE